MVAIFGACSREFGISIDFTEIEYADYKPAIHTVQELFTYIHGNTKNLQVQRH